LRWTYTPRMLDWFRRFIKSSSEATVQRSMESLKTLLDQAYAAHLELADYAGNSAAIQQRGWIKAFETDAGFRNAKADFDRMQSQGVSCEYLSKHDLQSKEPNLSCIFKHAIIHKDCGQIENPAAYTQALGAKFLLNGGSYIKAEVTALECYSGNVVAARTRTDRY